jgi:hypothetical protein
LHGGPCGLGDALHVEAPTISNEVHSYRCQTQQKKAAQMRYL